MLLADIDLIRKDEDFFAYLKKIYSVKRKSSRTESINSDKNSNNSKNSNFNDEAQKKINSFFNDFFKLVSKHQITFEGINELKNNYLEHGSEQTPMNENIPNQNNNNSIGNS